MSRTASRDPLQWPLRSTWTHGSGFEEHDSRGFADSGRSLTSARVSKKIAPNLPGTMRRHSQYGGQLLCVRYRDDPANGRRVVTVELLVDERPLPPPPDSKPSPTGLVAAAIPYGETYLRLQARGPRAGTGIPKASCATRRRFRRSKTGSKSGLSCSLNGSMNRRDLTARLGARA